MALELLRKRFKSVLGRSVAAVGWQQRLLSGGGVVVAYHRVTNRVPMNGLVVSEEMFREYCLFYRSHFDVVTLTELVNRLERRLDTTGCLAITFDDGYQDNYYCAVPILRDTGLPATFFVVSQFVGSEHVPWWDERLGMQAQWMTWEQLGKLVSWGFEIGSHTRTHSNLAEISTAQAEQEIFLSKQDFAEHGIDVTHFAYPYGLARHFTEPCRELVRRAGYHSCATLEHMTCRDPLDLGRVPISHFYLSPYHFLGDILIQSRKR